MRLRAYHLQGAGRDSLISDILHCIKYDVEESHYYWLEDCKYGVENYDSLTEDEKINLCILATFTDVAYEKENTDVDSWSKDPKLHLANPYRDRFVRPIDFFGAYQAEYDHNVYFTKTAYEVV